MDSLFHWRSLSTSVRGWGHDGLKRDLRLHVHVCKGVLPMVTDHDTVDGSPRLVVHEDGVERELPPMSFIISKYCVTSSKSIT